VIYVYNEQYDHLSLQGDTSSCRELYRLQCSWRSDLVFNAW